MNLLRKLRRLFLFDGMKDISHLDIYIRCVFCGFMLLPLFILCYFIVNLFHNPDCITLYLHNKRISSTPRIAWPHQGLLTIWFDNSYFEQNNASILPLMQQYQFPGVISLASGQSCPISISKLLKLQHVGWEIIPSAKFSFIHGQHAINDMPATDAAKYVIYDISSPAYERLLEHFLAETKARNGWILLYFHTSSTAKKAEESERLGRIFRVIKHANIPVVLHKQVWRVSQ